MQIMSLGCFENQNGFTNRRYLKKNVASFTRNWIYTSSEQILATHVLTSSRWRAGRLRAKELEDF